jgi:copper chaperone CopZ
MKFAFIFASVLAGLAALVYADNDKPACCCTADKGCCVDGKCSKAEPCCTDMPCCKDGCCTTEACCVKHTVEVKDDKTPVVHSATLIVNGMSCPLCSNNVDKQLLKIDGVTKAAVDLGSGKVRITLAAEKKVSKSQLEKAVDDAGYTLKQVLVAAS